MRIYIERKVRLSPFFLRLTKISRPLSRFFSGDRGMLDFKILHASLPHSVVPTEGINYCIWTTQ